MNMYNKYVNLLLKENAEVIVICAKIEEEIAELEGEEKEMFLAELGIEESGLDQLIRASYNCLDWQHTLQLVFRKFVLGHSVKE